MLTEGASAVATVSPSVSHRPMNTSSRSSALGRDAVDISLLAIPVCVAVVKSSTRQRRLDDRVLFAHIRRLLVLVGELKNGRIIQGLRNNLHSHRKSATVERARHADRGQAVV